MGEGWRPVDTLGHDLQLTNTGPPAELSLRTNDNQPGNGDGAFTGQVTVDREPACYTQCR